MTMRRHVWACAAGFIALALGAPPLAGAAAPKPITGKLNRPGYTVIALAANGAARTQRARTGRFRLRPTAQRVTLHLRAPDGSYAGPIVVGSASKGARAIVGIRAGAALGTVRISGPGGYAKPVRRLAKKWIEAKWIARARKGIPIGAGNFGLVRSASSRLSVPKDSDFDGVPNSLDVDDDGDRILDDYDASTKTRSSISLPAFSDGSHMHASTFMLAGQDLTNVGGGSTDGQVAAALQEFGWLTVTWTGIDPGTGELDCRGLSYCSAGGTGRVVTSQTGGRAGFPAFPECCDGDHDGLGSLTKSTAFAGNPEPDGGNMVISHGAAPDRIHTGDILIARGTADGTPFESPTTVGYIFSTFSVLASYNDGQGNTRDFTYGPTRDPRGPPAVRPGPSGDIVLALKLWRPQRPRIEGEAGTVPWIDVGNLQYGVTVGAGCPQSALSTSDPKLRPLSGPAPSFPPGINAGGFADLAGDQPSNPANTFSYTLNVTRCLGSRGASLHAGDFVGIGTRAISVGPPEAGDPFAVSFKAFVVQG